MLKPPVQAKDNPHNIIEDSMAWARFEYEATRGSMHGLVDYTKRYKLMSVIANDRGNTLSVVNAMSYLLEVPIES